MAGISKRYNRITLCNILLVLSAQICSLSPYDTPRKKMKVIDLHQQALQMIQMVQTNFPLEIHVNI
jgi:hypothetical protein